MKIMYYKGAKLNFGDDLNPWMWPKILPGFFNDDEATLFIGIGSIIGDHYNKSARKIIFGTGYVPQYAYQIPDDLDNGNWDVYFVRGPRTARALNLASDLSLGDSAILLRTLIDHRNRTPKAVSFVPHCSSLEHGQWEKVCELAGINLIDPRRPVEEVIEALLGSKLVIAEAMHGAIVADALRIPWVPVLPIDALNREKWLDWSEAIGVSLKPYRLWPSNLPEAKIAVARRPLIAGAVDFLASSPACGMVEKGFAQLAAHRLSSFAALTPSLSEDKIMDDITARMQEKVEQLRRNYAA